MHTNTVEAVFSIFKRGMRGVYQHCSEKHLHRYLAEFGSSYIIESGRVIMTNFGLSGWCSPAPASRSPIKALTARELRYTLASLRQQIRKDREVKAWRPSSPSGLTRHLAAVHCSRAWVAF